MEDYFENPVSIFRRTSALFVGFKMNPLRQSVFPKTNSNFAVKVAEISNRLFSAYFGESFKYLYSLICESGMYRT